MKVWVMFYKWDSPEKMREPQYASTRKKERFLDMGRTKFADKIEGVCCMELDDTHLFSNQINTQTQRIFDWVEYLRDPGDPNCKGHGHYILDDSLKAINALRDAKHVCSFCGFQTYSPDAHSEFCPRCAPNEYLTQDRLWMTRLVPVSRQRAFVEHATDMNGIPVPDWARERFEQKQYAALMQRKNKYANARMKDIQDIRRNIEIMSAVYDRGLDPRQLDAVYHKHKDELVFGSFNPVSEGSANMIRGRMQGFTLCKWKIK